MAKANLKTLNNNNVTQTSNSPIFSKKSFTYNFYMFLNLIQLTSVFFSHKYYYYFKFFNILTMIRKFKFLVKNKQTIYPFKFVFFKNVLVKFFFLNNNYVVVLDYFESLNEGLNLNYDVSVFLKEPNKYNALAAELFFC